MRGKYKPQRGRARRFTSSHDPDAYIRSRPARGEEEEEGSCASDSENGSRGDKGKRSTDSDGDDSVTSSSSAGKEESTTEEEKGEGTPEREIANLSLNDSKTSTAGAKKASGPAGTTGAPRELSRREREAIEKERARQHFLKMKEKEDAARLAIIRKRREEEAARHVAELKAKEEARFARR